MYIYMPRYRDILGCLHPGHLSTGCKPRDIKSTPTSDVENTATARVSSPPMPLAKSRVHPSIRGRASLHKKGRGKVLLFGWKRGKRAGWSFSFSSATVRTIIMKLE